MKPLIIAHRGYSAKFADNSWTAIRSAFESGAEMCEVDLHLTRDNRVFIYHDYYVQGRLIAEQTLRELKDIFPDHPDLEELIGWASEKEKRFLLEVKDRRMVSVLSDILRHVKKDLFIVGSFDAIFVKEFKERNPDIKVCLLLGTVLSETATLTLIRETRAEFILPAWEARHPYPQELLSDNWIYSLKERGVLTVSWHEERENVLKNLLSKPLYGICTNNPPLVKRLRDGA